MCKTAFSIPEWVSCVFPMYFPGTYRRPLARLDRLHHGAADGEVGRLEQRLQSFGELQTYVAGNWGEGSQDLHSLVQSCAEARVAHICRSTGRQESEHLLGTIVGQYRRLISTCAVRAQAMCLLARVGLITPAARDAARRRQVAMRLEGQMREERRAQWMASLQGPGWARRGRCHGLWSSMLMHWFSHCQRSIAELKNP